jgi:hypothetical protein
LVADPDGHLVAPIDAGIDRCLLNLQVEAFPRAGVFPVPSGEKKATTAVLFALAVMED